MTPPLDPTIKLLRDNARERRKALKAYNQLRDELIEAVRRAQAAGEPTMTAMAKASGVDRRTLYDLLKNERSSRVGVGLEKGLT